MKRGLLDEDIRPGDRLIANLDGLVEFDVGIDGTEDALIAALDERDLVVCTSRIKITDRVLRETDLEIIAKLGTGIDNVDLDAARERGVPVTYTPGANAMAVAEHTVGLMISVRRRLVESHEHLQGGGWRDEVEPGRHVYGSTVGLVGYGDIGRRVAALLGGFDVDVVAYDPYVPSFAGELGGAELVDLETVLERADVLSVHAELTEETAGLLGADELARLPRGAILVNTARGPIVDEEALIEALRNGRLAGAGLDVFEAEPVSADSPLFDLENVVTTPHVAAGARESRDRVIDLMSENLRALLAGEGVDPRYLAVPPRP